MGGTLSSTGNISSVSRCDDGTTTVATPQLDDKNSPGMNNNGPPPMRKVLTIEEKVWAKVCYEILFELFPFSMI
jgi:hypothetical protein